MPSSFPLRDKFLYRIYITSMLALNYSRNAAVRKELHFTPPAYKRVIINKSFSIAGLA